MDEETYDELLRKHPDFLSLPQTEQLRIVFERLCESKSKDDPVANQREGWIKNLLWGVFKTLFCLALVIGVLSIILENGESEGVKVCCHVPDVVERFACASRVSFTELLAKKNMHQTDFVKALLDGADPNEHVLLPEDEFRKLRKVIVSIATSEGSELPTPITRENFFTTPLCVAISGKYGHLFDLLMERNADPNVSLHPMSTPPLQLAVMAQNVTWVKTLLEHGADVNALSPMGNAVSVAVVSWKSKYDAFEKAMSDCMDGANKDVLLTFNELAQCSCAGLPSTTDGKSYEILRMLLEKGGNVNIKNVNGLFPLVSAIVAHNYDAFLTLLPYYEDVDSLYCEKDGLRIPLVFLAVRSSSAVLVRALVQKGANLNVTLSNGEKVIDWANTVEMKELLRNLMEGVAGQTNSVSASQSCSKGNYEDWLTIKSAYGMELKIPPMLELRGGRYKGLAEVYAKNASKVLKVPIGNAEFVIQQSGLNTNNAESLRHYVRVMYKCKKGLSGDYWKLGEIPSISHGELQQLDSFARLEVEQELSDMRRIGLIQRLVKWDKMEVSSLAGRTALLISYVRQLKDSDPVKVLQYRVGDDDRLHCITFSYRMTESDMWLPVWEQMKHTFKFLETRDGDN